MWSIGNSHDKSSLIWASTRENLRGGGGGGGGGGGFATLWPTSHPRSLISTSVIRFLESIISKPATSQISIF